MKLSRRARRMEKHHKRSKSGTGLNLTSLMDIFTILVFFLLVSQSEIQDLPSTKTIKLPDSSSIDRPKESVAIIVSKDDIIFQGTTIASVSRVIASNDDVIQPLKSELLKATQAVLAEDPTKEREVTIMGDRDLQYKLIKKLMITCAQANYNSISLAVVKKTNVNG